MTLVTARRLCSLSVDLDPLSCYYRIHALGEGPPAALADAIFKKTVPRFLDVFARHGVRATFFIVGSDLEGATARRRAARSPRARA